MVSHWLICISLVLAEFGHLFICLLACWIPCSINGLIMSDLKKTWDGVRPWPRLHAPLHPLQVTELLPPSLHLLSIFSRQVLCGILALCSCQWNLGESHIFESLTTNICVVSHSLSFSISYKQRNLMSNQLKQSHSDLYCSVIWMRNKLTWW